jgi:hypothetical protein
LMHNALCSAIPPEMVAMITNNETVKEAWDAIATMRISNDRMKKATTQQLCRKYDLTAFKEGRPLRTMRCA